MPSSRRVRQKLDGSGGLRAARPTERILDRVTLGQNRPNIFSIPQVAENVNRNLRKITKISVVQNEITVNLYNIPY